MTVAAPWLRQYPRGVPESYDLPPVLLDRLLDDAAQDFPDSVAVAYGRRRLTYREVQDQSDRLAAGLRRIGVTAGDTVGVALGRTPQAVVTLFAVWRMGAVVGLLEPVASTEVLTRRAERLDCRAVVCEERHAGGLTQLRGVGTPVLTGPEDALAFPRNLAARARRSLRRSGRDAARLSDLVHRSRPYGDVSPADPRSGLGRVSTAAAVTTATNGTTRAYAHAELLAAAFHLRLWIPDAVAGAERVVSGLPLHTALGLTATVTMPVLSGGTLVLVDRDDPRALGRAVHAADATLLFLPQGATGPLVAALRGEAPALRLCMESGPVDHHAVAEVEQRTGARLRGTWTPAGCTGPVVAEPVYGLTKPGSAGIPVTDTHVLVLDDDTGAVVPPGAWGRLLAAGPQTGLGPATWLDTGACAAVDQDGYLRFPPSDDAQG